MGFPTIYITAPLLSMFINNEGNNLEIIVKGFFYIFLGMIIAAPVNGFFIGAIIGFIIGKIKSKNTQNINNQNIIKRR
ncbi:hypothetical protein J4221_05945 [Candidatus Pacearchaeota archaeon]|nr:hypothetical protein [Candidatus Pacearchaeota archaeon]